MLELTVTRRYTTKKPASLRTQGVLPAVIYGRKEEPTPISVDAKQRVSRPPGPNSILSYVVRLESGTVRFADASPGISKEERKAAAFTREVAIGVCRLSR